MRWIYKHRPLNLPAVVRWYMRHFESDEWLRMVRYDTEQQEARNRKLEIGVAEDEFFIPASVVNAMRAFSIDL